MTEEHTSAGRRKIVHGPGIDEPVCMIEADGFIFYFHADVQGSVLALSNSTGKLVETYAYSPFGETHVHGSSTGKPKSPYLYTGREFDSDTGLYYYRARSYSPKLGRFLQPDPLGYADGVNLYAYTGSDPCTALSF